MTNTLITDFDSALPVAGFALATIAANIRYKDRDDLLLVQLSEQATTAAVFTQNAFCAAPVTIAKQHIKTIQPRYLLINAGNANAGTGEKGMQTAQQCCELVAKLGNCTADEVLPFSTGVIGMDLPVEKFAAALPKVITQLAEDNWQQAAKAIMTTDTVPKLVSVTTMIDGEKITLTGIAKGAGMIHPNMATMLAYLATDANINKDLLQDCLQSAVAKSFNRITIDGDTSTNDACVLVATAAADLVVTDVNRPQFQSALDELCETLAKALIIDGEGATKLINIEVNSGANISECEQVAFTIAHSPLVKTAFFASDPNWGRILAAIGRSGVTDLEINRLQVYLDEVCIVSDGGRDANYTEAQGQQVMSQNEITIRVELHRGNSSATVWTCDFSYDYVKINAEYRS